MNDQTNTGINPDITREIKGYCPSIADPLLDGTYDLSELDLSFDEACQKLAAFRKEKNIKLDDDDENENEDKDQ